MQYALLLRYTSLQSYKLLLDEFPLPSISLLNKIKEGNIDALKAAKLLLENSSISKDILVLVLFDEMYLQKCAEYRGGECFGSNIDNELYNSIVCFMIIGLKENMPCVVKAAPVTFIKSELLKDELYGTVHLIKNVRNYLLRKKRLVFPQFSFFEFNEDVIVNPSEMSWKLLHDVHEKDQ